MCYERPGALLWLSSTRRAGTLAPGAAAHQRLPQQPNYSISCARWCSGGWGVGSGDVRELPGRGALAFARLAAVDGGVTARLDVIDEVRCPERKGEGELGGGWEGA